ncbi:MAG: hypothetical protein EA420_15230 [Candidatus Competibacteraceae bacterium]|nr:MAG: hypothetical protein EA420_15230 [Candidatus Competibacteraceae bacterium]
MVFGRADRNRCFSAILQLFANLWRSIKYLFFNWLSRTAGFLAACRWGKSPHPATKPFVDSHNTVVIPTFLLRKAVIMYLCICKAVSDNQIRQAVAQGARTVGDVSVRLGAGTECGKCLDSIRELLDAVLTEPSTGVSPRPESSPARPSLPTAGHDDAWTAMFAGPSTPAESPSEPSESSSRGPAQ